MQQSMPNHQSNMKLNSKVRKTVPLYYLVVWGFTNWDCSVKGSYSINSVDLYHFQCFLAQFSSPANHNSWLDNFEQYSIFFIIQLFSVQNPACICTSKWHRWRTQGWGGTAQVLLWKGAKSAMDQFCHLGFARHKVTTVNCYSFDSSRKEDMLHKFKNASTRWQGRICTGLDKKWTMFRNGWNVLEGLKSSRSDTVQYVWDSSEISQSDLG